MFSSRASVRQPPCSFATKITQDTNESGVIGIKMFIKDNNLNDSEPPLNITTGNCTDNPNTLKDYSNRWADICRFCMIIGDYQSATLLDRTLCPSNPFPMLPSTIAQYFDYCTLPKGRTLLKPGSTEEVKDISGNTVECTGRWNAPINIEKCKTAIELLHTKYDNLNGPYRPKCELCRTNYDKYKNNLNNSTITTTTLQQYKNIVFCEDHADGPLIRPRGNAMESNVAREAYERCHKLMVREWSVTGNIQLLPGDVRRLQRHLCSTNNLCKLQIYTMMIIGIKCFFRANELIKLKIDNFEPEYFIVREGCIETLCVKIRGKCDRNDVRLQLFKDNECPEFCPVRHLLVYMACSGITSGSLFPSPKELHQLKNVVYDINEKNMYGKGRTDTLQLNGNILLG